MQGVAGDLRVRQGGGGEGDVDLSGLHGGKGGVLVLEDDGDLLHGGDGAVVVLVGLQDKLLLLVPLDELEGPGADGGVAVAGAVGVLGDDAHRSHGVEECGGGLRHGKDNGAVIRGLHLLQEGQVQGRLTGLRGLEGKDHVGGGKGLAVGKFHALPEAEGPGQAVFGEGVVLGQVVDEAHVLTVLHQGALDQGRGPVAPALAGVQGLRFAGDGDDDLVFRSVLRRAGGLAAGGLGRAAAGGEADSQGQAQEQGKQFFLHEYHSLSLVTGYG